MKMRTLTLLGLVMATTVSGCAVTSGSVRQQAQLCPGNWTATGHILSGYEFELSRPITVGKREALMRIGEFIKDDPESDTLYIRTFLPDNGVMRAELPVLNNPARYSLMEVQAIDTPEGGSNLVMRLGVNPGSLLLERHVEEYFCRVVEGAKLYSRT